MYSFGVYHPWTLGVLGRRPEPTRLVVIGKKRRGVGHRQTNVEMM